MKKVLIISFNHNISEIIGSIRCRGFAKYLILFDWEPIVLTALYETNEIFPYSVYQTKYYNQFNLWKKRFGFNDNHTIKDQLNKQTLKNKKTFFDHFLSIIVDFVSYPDVIKKGWYSTTIAKAEEIISSKHIDAIISSFPPATCHLIAEVLSKEFSIPWIADYRDLWTNSHYYPYSSVRRIVDNKLERRLLSYTTAITVAAESYEIELKKIIANKDIYTIENGFDPTLFNKSTIFSKKFNIVYTGNLYKGMRDPEKLFISLKELIEENNIDSNKLQVDFYGNYQDWLIKDIKKNNLECNVLLHGPISKGECFEKQKQAQVLLLQTMNDSRDAGIIPGKLFDYFAARRPILSIGHKDSIIKKLLTKTNAGVHVSELSEIKSQIIKFYGEFILKRNVSYNGIESEINKYSHEQMALKMSRVLNKYI